jgi:predicted ArsR family transcriptional regulator
MDKQPKTFQELLSRVDFTHNTLRQHLDQLLDRGLVESINSLRMAQGGQYTSTASLRI